MILGRRPGITHHTGRRIVDIGDRAHPGTRYRFIGALAIGVAGDYRNAGAHIGIGERIATGNRTGNVRPVALPLVLHLTHIHI